ncbi:hypothetical protein Mapa_011478 [Marchantia paleacea]|nr:hypothetical protein Mapa_011478 [Marchantia paleacea]
MKSFGVRKPSKMKLRISSMRPKLRRLMFSTATLTRMYVDQFQQEPDDEEGDEDEDERRPAKKKLLAGRPSSNGKKKGDKKKKSVTKKSVSSLVEIAAAAAAGGGSQRPPTKPPRPPKPVPVANQENRESNLDPEGAQGIRKSTRMAVVVKQAEREAQQAALQALAKPIIKKKKEEERKITQEEMLLEAAQTEIQNLQTLEIMLAREEEVKRKAIIHKATYSGPLIRFHSRDGINTLGFTKVEEFPEVFNSSCVPYPKKVLCVITGLPAKYRDPRTGQPYASKEAFKLIRERFSKGENTGRRRPEESHQRKRTKVERERPGPGSRTNVAKLKFKKVISTTNIDASSLPQPGGIVPGQALSRVEVEVLTTQPSPGPPPEYPGDLGFSPVSTSSKNDGCNLRLDGNSMGRDLPALDMPEPINEANEADFLLDDLEVSLPSNLDSSLSLPTSSSMSPILLNHSTGDNEARDVHLEQEEMMVMDSEQDQALLPMDMLQFSDLDGLETSGKPS